MSYEQLQRLHRWLECDSKMHFQDRHPYLLPLLIQRYHTRLKMLECGMQACTNRKASWSVRRGQQRALLQGRSWHMDSLLDCRDHSGWEPERMSICLHLGALRFHSARLDCPWENKTLRLFPGLPRRSFFSGTAFLGGIFFLKRDLETEKERLCGAAGRQTVRKRSSLEYLNKVQTLRFRN